MAQFITATESIVEISERKEAKGPTKPPFSPKQFQFTENLHHKDMGNCQAAEAATVVIQHPKGKVERIYWSVSANEVMTSNPGHYVAVVITSVSAKSANATPVKQLKLVRPDDTLHIGHVYRLISFEEVLKEFGGKKYTRLSRWISMKPGQAGDGGEENTGVGDESNGLDCADKDGSKVSLAGNVAEEVSKAGGRSLGVGRYHKQWRPALHSIAEVGSS
ncbi:hypothetical protein CKAN_00645500 [Cinnamomum micranthum f. kanehirae]|uniref:DUF4228 domain-containing protein n=1 Tax=Cinnamomum micranthum f. kanehirae TaxID=337451 RepID=A0A443NHE3_9MAGN|nr:hypothetical protein CKAN_00645500 [Cinnamomum micranthum f. kanehirae]